MRFGLVVSVIVTAAVLLAVVVFVTDRGAFAWMLAAGCFVGVVVGSVLVDRRGSTGRAGTGPSR